MSVLLYNEINKVLSTLVKQTRFFDPNNNTQYNFLFRWGYQPTIDKIDQKEPFFYAYIQDINLRGTGTINEIFAKDDEYTYSYHMNNEVRVQLGFIQQQAREDYIGLQTDRDIDGSFILAKIIAGLWTPQMRRIYRQNNTGILSVGRIINRSARISGRWVRDFTCELDFDTLVAVTDSQQGGPIARVCMEYEIDELGTQTEEFCFDTTQ